MSSFMSNDATTSMDRRKGPLSTHCSHAPGHKLFIRRSPVRPRAFSAYSLRSDLLDRRASTLRPSSLSGPLRATLAKLLPPLRYAHEEELAGRLETGIASMSAIRPFLLLAEWLLSTQRGH